MIIVPISDVHEKWDKLVIPKCDLLISTGDYSFHGDSRVVGRFHKWLNQQDAKHIISVQGNHELWVEKNFYEAKAIAEKNCPRVHFEEEGLVEIEGKKIWCSSITPWFCDWAWNRQRGPEIKKHWDLIPEDIDILATHGPAYGFLDVVYRADGITPKERVGCHQLADKIKLCKKLKLHVFGHIHGSSGETEFNGVKYINASICDEIYLPSYPVRVTEI